MAARARRSRNATRLIVALAATAWASTPAIAQTLWGEVPLPGGVAAAREVFQLGQSDGRVDAGWLADFIRHYTPGGLTAVADRLNRYTTTLTDIQSQASQWPQGVALPTSATGTKDRARIKTFLETLGIDLEERRGTYEAAVDSDTSSSAVERNGWLGAQLINRRSLVADLNAGRPIVVNIASGTLPLPLPDYWAREVFKHDKPSVAGIAWDRRTALTYLGLLALDNDTLTFLSARPNLVRRLETDESGAFADFGRSLRVKNGVVEVPGGDDAVGVWTRLIGCQPHDADQFVSDLFDRDQGRLAYFYDTLAHLLPAQRAFALGAYVPAGARAAFVRRLYDAFAILNPEWKIPTRPFFRPRFDAASVLMSVDVWPDGSVGPTLWRPLLERVWSTDEWPGKSLRALKPQPADAVWLIQWVFQRPEGALERFQSLRFLQRQFHDGAPGDARAVEVLAFGRKHMPALALTLERMGVADVDVLTTMMTAAHELTESGDRDDVMTALARWQAALGLLEQAQRHVKLPPSKLDPLLLSLAGMSQAELKRSTGAFSTWFVDKFLPAFVPADTPLEDVDQALVEALSGAGGPRTHVSWEGLDYVIDSAGPIAKTAWAVREKSAGPRVRDLLALEDVRRRLRRAPLTVADVGDVARALGDLEPAIRARPAPITNDDLDEFHDAIGALRNIKQAKDLSRAGRQLPLLGRVLDLSAECVVRSTLYALAVSPTTQPADVFARAWYFHTIELGPMAVQPEQFARPKTWKDVAWQVPVVEARPEGGTLVRGSFLGVDAALSDSQLPVVPLTDAVALPVIADIDRTPLVRSLVFRGSPTSFDVRAAAALLAALQNGQARVAAWRHQSPDMPTLANALREAGVDEWRANLIAWQWSRAADAASAALMARDIYALGTSESLSLGWTGADSRQDGCFCYARNPTRAPEDVRWRDADAALMLESNVSLYLLEEVDRLHLPVALVPLMMPRAMETWLGHVAQYDATDWEGLAAWPHLSASADIDDLLLFLVSNGSLRSPHVDEIEPHP